MTDLEHVPTLPELHTQGLATVVGRNANGDPTHYLATPKGQQMIYDAMRRNAEKLAADPDLARETAYAAIRGARVGA